MYTANSRNTVVQLGERMIGDQVFVWFDSLRSINNLSVIKGQVFVGWTSTKLGLMFLLNNNGDQVVVGSNPTIGVAICPWAIFFILIA